MSIFRNFEYFKEEIELALIQNACVEIELYSIIASIIRESKNECKLSVRDVSNRRKSGISNKFYGESGFPDFVLLSREKDSNACQYGCIEAKMPTVPLDEQNQQLIGHIQSFGKVIYTNGIRWIYFENSQDCRSFDITLGNIQDNRIVWESNDKWNCLLKEIDNIKWY